MTITVTVQPPSVVPAVTSGATLVVTPNGGTSAAIIGSTLRISVADIDDPSTEMAAVADASLPAGTIRIATQDIAGANAYRLYVLDAASNTAQSTPNRIDRTAGGQWVQIGGKGVAGGFTVETTFAAGASTLASAVITGAASVGTTLGVTGAATFSSTVGITGVATVTNATASSSTSTGAVVVTGGVGIGGAAFIGGVASFTNTTDASAIGTAAVVMSGGLSIAKSAWIAGDVSFSTSTNTALVRQTVSTAGVALAGGTSSASSSGGLIQVFGNAHASVAGWGTFDSGNVASAQLLIRNFATVGGSIAMKVNGGAVTALSIDNAGLITLGTSTTLTLSQTTGTTLAVSSTAASTTTTSGCATFAGGVGVVGQITFGGGLVAKVNSGSTINFDCSDTAASRTVQMFRVNTSATAHTTQPLYDVISAASTSSDLMVRVRANSVNLWTVSADGTTAASGVWTFSNSTVSSSSTTGAVVVTGGLGVGGSAFIGTNLTVAGTFTVTSKFSITSAGASTFTYSNAGTTDTPAAQILDRRTSGTPAAGFGVKYAVLGQSDTTTGQDLGSLVWSWATATHASRKSRFIVNVSDAANDREVMRGEASGSAPMIGVLGASAVVRQTVTGSRGGNAALASFLTAMATFGWITDSTSA